jgi:hypothetical protein
MADYGLPLHFGLSVTPDASALDEIQRLVDVGKETGRGLHRGRCIIGK